jgi:hypothetical protein
MRREQWHDHAAAGAERDIGQFDGGCAAGRHTGNDDGDHFERERDGNG